MTTDPFEQRDFEIKLDILLMDPVEPLSVLRQIFVSSPSEVAVREIGPPRQQIVDHLHLATITAVQTVTLLGLRSVIAHLPEDMDTHLHTDSL
jgi:hypothetical protein